MTEHFKCTPELNSHFKNLDTTVPVSAIGSLIGASEQAVLRRAHKLDISKKQNTPLDQVRLYTEQEDAFIRRYAVVKGIDFCARSLNRTKEGIKSSEAVRKYTASINL